MTENRFMKYVPASKPPVPEDDPIQPIATSNRFLKYTQEPEGVSAPSVGTGNRFNKFAAQSNGVDIDELEKNQSLVDSVYRLAQKHDPDAVKNLHTNKDVIDYFVSNRRWVDSNTWSMAGELSKAQFDYDENDKKDLAYQLQVWKQVPDAWDKVQEGDLKGAAEKVWSNLWRGVVDPVNLIGLGTGKALGIGARVAIGAGTDALISGGMNIGQQSIEKEVGLRDEVDLGEAGKAAALGAGASAVGNVALSKFGTPENLETTFKEELGGTVADAAEGGSTVYPPGHPKYAGSINLNRRFESDETKNLILEISETNNDFTDMRRSGMSMKDVDSAAQDILDGGTVGAFAEDLGIDPKDPSKWRSGMTMNAEQVTAARVELGKRIRNMWDLAAKARNGTDVDVANYRLAMASVVEQQGVVAAVSSELGRAMRSLRETVDADGIVPQEVIDSILSRSGGADRVREMADLMLRVDPSDPTFTRKMATIARGFDNKVTTSDKVKEVFYNSLLSSPSTHIVNAMSNVVTQTLSVVETAGAAALGTFKKSDKVYWGEVGARVGGMYQGAVDGFRLAAKAFVTEDASDAVSKLDVNAHAKAIDGVKGRLVRTPSNLLLASDEFFKSIARRGELSQLAYAKAKQEGLSGEAFTNRVQQLMANPDQTMKAMADDAARYYTFQSRPGAVASKIMSLREAVPGAFVVLPFVRTPANIVKFSFERTPLVMLTDTARNNFKAGGRSADIARSRAIIGTSAFAASTALASAGLVTGDLPDDPGERSVAAMTQQPYSVRIGDKWYSYSRMDPVGFILGMGADALKIGDAVAQADAEKASGAVIAMMSQTLINKTWLQGFSNLVEAINDPERYGGSFVNSLGGLVVPSVIAADARATDPVMRDARDIWDTVMSRTRWTRPDLAPRVDLFGNIIETDAPVGGDSWLARMSSPIAVKEASDDLAVQEMMRLGVRQTAPDRTFQLQGGSVKLNSDQYFDLSFMKGRRAKQYVDAFVSNPEYQNLHPEYQRQLFDLAFRRAGDEARKLLVLKHPDLVKDVADDKLKDIMEPVRNYPSSLKEAMQKWFE